MSLNHDLIARFILDGSFKTRGKHDRMCASLVETKTLTSSQTAHRMSGIFRDAWHSMFHRRRSEYTSFEQTN